MKPWVGGLVLLALALCTHTQAAHWASDTTLWGAVVRAQPTNPRAWLNYAEAEAINGDAVAAEVAIYRGWRAGLSRDQATRRLTHGLALVQLAMLRYRAGDVWGARLYAAETRRYYPSWPLSQWICGWVGV